MSKDVHVKLIYKRYFIATKNISGKQLHEIDLAIKEKNENNIKFNRVLDRIKNLIINNPHSEFKNSSTFKTFFGIRCIIT